MFQGDTGLFLVQLAALKVAFAGCLCAMLILDGDIRLLMYIQNSLVTHLLFWRFPP